MGRRHRPDFPRRAKEKSGDAERAPHMARQNDALECIPENRHQQRKSENSDEYVHRCYLRLAWGVEIASEKYSHLGKWHYATILGVKGRV